MDERSLIEMEFPVGLELDLGPHPDIPDSNLVGKIDGYGPVSGCLYLRVRTGPNQLRYIDPAWVR